MIMLRRRDGQTLIETALILLLLLFIVVGIAEFSRVWFVKNSLKNAARTGARVAVVTEGITTETRSYSAPGDCAILTGNDKVFCYIWKAPGKLPAGATLTATLTISDDIYVNGVADEGETVSVSANISDLKSIVPGLFRTFIPSQFSADASMRYE